MEQSPSLSAGQHARERYKPPQGVESLQIGSGEQQLVRISAGEAKRSLVSGVEGHILI